MSLKPAGIGAVPEETAHVARAAYPKGNTYLKMRDELGTIYDDAAFAHLFPNNGQPAEAPWRLALVRSCSSSRGCQIGRPLMLSEVTWIGNMRLGWS